MKHQQPENRQDRPFSLKERGKSFVYAYKGLCRFLSSEHNARLHLLATVIVIILGLIFDIEKMEWLALILVMGLVWITELLNTAIEKIVDEVALERNPKWAFIKDVAAGAVLVAGMLAVLAGLLVFWNPACKFLFRLF